MLDKYMRDNEVLDLWHSLQVMIKLTDHIYKEIVIQDDFINSLMQCIIYKDSGYMSMNFITLLIYITCGNIYRVDVTQNNSSYIKKIETKDDLKSLFEEVFNAIS